MNRRRTDMDGRHTDVLYAGATVEDGVLFTPLCEF